VHEQRQCPDDRCPVSYAFCVEIIACSHRGARFPCWHAFLTPPIWSCSITGD
jgi:hypothetical protein